MNLEGEEVETVEEETQETEEAVAEEAIDEETADDGLVVQFGDEGPEPDESEGAPEWVKELRRTNREQAKRIKELEAAKSETSETKLGAKPTLESCDYDQDQYEQKLAQWFEDKRKADAEAAQAEEQRRKAEEQWQARLADFQERKAALAKRVDDVEEAEAFILDTFDVTQQGILVDIADDGAVLAYALAKNPTKAKELAAEKSYTRFTKKLTLLEASMKTSPRKAPPPADKPLKSTAGLSGTVDGELDRLREEAARTGDFSKVHAYKKMKRAS